MAEHSVVSAEGPFWAFASIETATLRAGLPGAQQWSGRGVLEVRGACVPLPTAAARRRRQAAADLHVPGAVHATARDLGYLTSPYTVCAAKKSFW